MMDSLVGDGIKQYTVTSSKSGASVVISLFAWVENTSRIRDVAI